MNRRPNELASYQRKIVEIDRRPNELASYQRKIVEIDTHMGIAMSGLTADARALSKYLKLDCSHW